MPQLEGDPSTIAPSLALANVPIADMADAYATLRAARDLFAASENLFSPVAIEVMDGASTAVSDQIEAIVSELKTRPPVSEIDNVQRSGVLLEEAAYTGDFEAAVMVAAQAMKRRVRT